MVVMEWWKKFVDFVMPPIDEQETETVEKKVEAKVEPVQVPEQNYQQQTQAQNLVETMNTRRAAVGGGANSAVNFGGNYGASTAFKDTPARPNLKLIKPPEFVMKVYKPADYSTISAISDDILAHKAAIVNYEYVHAEEQRRICDYLDGLCYAVDGTVTKISEKIFLYVPAGISTGDIAALVASVRYH